MRLGFAWSHVVRLLWMCVLLLHQVICRDQLDQPMPVAAAANEEYKAAKEQGHGDNDFAAVYNAVSKQ